MSQRIYTGGEYVSEYLFDSMPAFMRLFSRLTHRGAARYLLNADRMIKSVSAQTSIDQWDNRTINQSLQVLLHSILQSPHLNITGALAHRSNLHRVLCNHRYLSEALRLFPEINQTKLHQPVLVSGVARSGTSYLHRSLALHPQALAPRTYQVLFTRDPRQLNKPDERIKKTISFLRKLRWCAPQILKMHPMDWRSFEECYFWLEPSGRSWQYSMTGELHDYSNWLNEQDMTPVYQNYRQHLNYLQYQLPPDHSEQQKFWCLKSPFHLFGLQAIIEQFPDTKIIIVHRDIVQTLGSWLSLVGLVRHLHHRKVNYHNIGQESLSYWKTGLEKLMQVSQRHPENFLHVRYKDLIKDRASLIKRLWQACGWPVGREFTFPDEKTQSAETSPNAFMSHKIEPFGLSESAIKQTLADYIDYTRTIDYC